MKELDLLQTCISQQREEMETKTTGIKDFVIKNAPVALMIEDVRRVGFMYLVFTRMPGESYRRRLSSLLYLCYVFRALINSLVRCSCCFFLSFCSDLGQELLLLISLFVLTLDESSCCQFFSFCLDFRQTLLLPTFQSVAEYFSLC